MHDLIVENPIIGTHWKLNDNVLKPSTGLSLTQTTMDFLERIDIDITLGDLKWMKVPWVPCS
jgi:hypothetical protein